MFPDLQNNSKLNNESLRRTLVLSSLFGTCLSYEVRLNIRYEKGAFRFRARSSATQMFACCVLLSAGARKPALVLEMCISYEL